ncbi:MAG: B12-binding domain-containing radical SAM protein [Nitrospina sp.]|nr:B12-binding domain-containing radical SAM protein [Nitrospina sp.]
MADVILIHAPLVVFRKGEVFFRSSGDEFSNYPMGLMYLASFLEKQGLSVRILDVTPDKLTQEDILDIIELEQPTLVGIGATSASVRSAIKIVRAIKIKYKNIPVCFGGAHINCDPEFFNRVDTGFDFCIVGEGEQTLYDAYLKLKNGEIVEGTLHGEAVDLDEIPFPARHLIRQENYEGTENGMKSALPTATMLGSRGCPFKCTFCSIPSVKHKVRFRSAKNIVDEMESIYETCNGYYSFSDDVLTLHEKRTIELCDEILRRGLRVRWSGMTRVDIISEKLISKLAAAGCHDLYFGVESGSERIRNEVIDKKVDDEEIYKAIQLCKKYRIQTWLFLMVGFPTETKEDVEKTVLIGRKMGADFIGIHLTIPFPGTKIYDHALEKGVIEHDLFDKFAQGIGWDDKETFNDKWPYLVPGDLTHQYMVDSKKRAYLKHYLHPQWAFSRLRHWIISSDRFKADLKLIKMAPHALLTGMTKTANA